MTYDNQSHPSITKPLNHQNRPQIDPNRPPMNLDELRQKERQKEIKTDRQKERNTKRHKDEKTERQKDRMMTIKN